MDLAIDKQVIDLSKGSGRRGEAKAGVKTKEPDLGARLFFVR